MSTRRKRAGDWGEQRAAEHLTRVGYEVVTRNWRAGRLGEVDIIARDGSTLVFVEVKTARNRAMGHPRTWVTQRKQEQIVRVTEVFLATYTEPYDAVRFDVVTVDATEHPPIIEHIVDAWRPT